MYLVIMYHLLRSVDVVGAGSWELRGPARNLTAFSASTISSIDGRRFFHLDLFEGR